MDADGAVNPSPAGRKAVLQVIRDGVEYLHRRDIMHNDLKPANTLVTRTGTARIIDFGLSASTDSIYRGCLGGTDGYSARSSTARQRRNPYRTSMLSDG